MLYHRRGERLKNLEAQLKAARATNQRLNRRAQRAEGAVAKRIRARPGGGLGRALSEVGYRMIERQLEICRSTLRAIAADPGGLKKRVVAEAALKAIDGPLLAVIGDEAALRAELSDLAAHLDELSTFANKVVYDRADLRAELAWSEHSRDELRAENDRLDTTNAAVRAELVERAQAMDEVPT
jgi:hypothetical protein